MKAGQTENEAMKGGQEYGRWGDLGNDAGIGERADEGTEIENLVEIAGKGGDVVCRAYLAFS